ncbi:uncharacterized protein LOC143889562 [Tasmannia lanceolata]|uniref:uncharacterized protein LOC143889562 n=1 Tax=Tasmannia lanceolata TaxID=3420 RepID=UPI0040649C4D
MVFVGKFEEIGINKRTMKFERQDEEEFEMLLDEIPQATSVPLHHHQQQNHEQNIHSWNGHSESHTQKIHGIYDDDPLYHGYVCVSPVGGVSLPSEGSSSSSLSGGLSLDDDRLPFEETKFQIPPRKTHHPNGYGLWQESELPNSSVRNNVNRTMIDELGLSEKLHKMQMDELGLSEKLHKMQMNELDLSEKLHKMQIRHEEDSVRFERSAIRNSIDSYGFHFDDGSSVGANRGNVVKPSPFEDCRNGLSNEYTGLRCSDFPNLAMLDEERRLSMLGLEQQCHMGNLSGFYNSSHRSNAPFAYPGWYAGLPNFPWNQAKVHPSGEAINNLQLHDYYEGIQVPNMVPFVNKPSISDSFLHLQKHGNDFSGDLGAVNSLSSPHMMHSKPSLGVGNLGHYRFPMFNDRMGASPRSWAPQSPSVRAVRNSEVFGYDDSFIIQGEGLNYVINNGHNLSRGGCKRGFYNDIARECSKEKDSELDRHSPKMDCPSPIPARYNSLLEVKGCIYFIARDQNGCRFLQRKFDEGNPQDVQMIFNEIIDHVIDLMIDPFGNYLMQKLFDVCNEEQRMQIILVVTGEPGELVKISLNTHGTRVVQKLIETLKAQWQILLVISALEPGFLDLIKDNNGNHVVQRCLQCLSNEDNKFIFAAAAKYCVDIATHQHGCCVLQRCIGHSTGKNRERLVAEISTNGLLLAQDEYGNYAMQYLLDLNIPSTNATLISQFEGNYIHLSVQKYSSNVVEKCLKVFGDESRSRIIHELLSTSQFEQLLQHPYANYVIQSALEVSKGPLYASLVEAIRPHTAALRNSPYCKRILSRTLLKK